MAAACGTVTAARAHYERGEKPCEKCKLALARAYRKRRKPDCGTIWALQRHQDLSEPLDSDCQEVIKQRERWDAAVKRAKQENRKPPPKFTKIVWCGTKTGASRHRVWREPTCELCLEAERADATAKRRAAGIPEAKRAKVAVCGTTSGHRKHLRDGTAPCESCLEAKRVAGRAARTRNKKPKPKKSKKSREELAILRARAARRKRTLAKTPDELAVEDLPETGCGSVTGFREHRQTGTMCPECLAAHRIHLRALHGRFVRNAQKRAQKKARANRRNRVAA